MWSAASMNATATCWNSSKARGVRPGARLHVSGRNYDQTLTLATDAGTVALGRSAAERVWVNGNASGAKRAPNLAVSSALLS